jgi:hypothetical protein
MRSPRFLTLFIFTLFSSAIAGAPSAHAFGRAKPTPPPVDPWIETQARAYPNGHVYFLIGDYKEGAQREYEKFYSVSTWLSGNGYKPIVIANARLIDIQEAVTNPHTTGIIYSSHGSPSGRLGDGDEKVLPKDIFANGASPRLRFFVISACHGDQCTLHHAFPDGAEKVFWEGKTYSPALLTYLFSEKFNEDLRKQTPDYREKCLKLFTRIE